MSGEMLVCRVRDWAQDWETKGSLKQVRPLGKISLTTPLDALAVRRLLLLPEGFAAYGAWILILQIASRCPRRGVLAERGVPYGAAELALFTGGSVERMAAALEVLCRPEIALLEQVTLDEALKLPTPAVVPVVALAVADAASVGGDAGGLRHVVSSPAAAEQPGCLEPVIVSLSDAVLLESEASVEPQALIDFARQSGSAGASPSQSRAAGNEHSSSPAVPQQPGCRPRKPNPFVLSPTQFAQSVIQDRPLRGKQKREANRLAKAMS